MILIVTAMKSEMSIIFDNLIEKVRIASNGFEAYKGKLCGNEVMLVQSGVGKVQAANALSNMLARFDVSLIVNIGVAGATFPYRVGDFVVIEEARYHDFDLKIFGYELGQVPGQPVVYKPEKRFNKKLMSECKLKKGVLFTGDKFLVEKLNIRNGYLVDMEGAAYFHVANNYQKPIVSIKVVSDIIGKTKLDEYTEFAEDEANNKIYEITKKVVSIYG